jgi:DNA polymerase-3 subunit epsilon
VTVPSFLAAYVDTETTGLSSRQDRIIEVAIVLARVDRLSGRIMEVLDEYQTLQDPGIRIPTMATMIHGITNDMVRGEEIDRQRVQALLSAATIVLAHNSGFDKGFVAQIVPEARECLWGCTCRGIPWKKIFPALGSTSLQTLASYFRTPCGTAHRALGDVKTTMNLAGLPGLDGGLAFQQVIFQKKLRKVLGLTHGPVFGADRAFAADLVRRRAAAFDVPGQARVSATDSAAGSPEERLEHVFPGWVRNLNRVGG